MSADENKTIARRFVQVWTRGNLDLVDELAAPDITVIYPVLGEPLHGAEAFKQLLAHAHAGMPDLELAIEEQIAEGDKVAIRWRASGTQRGEFMGIAPTGRSVAWTGITLYRLAGGRVVEERGEEDALGLMRQLGVVPPPAQAAAPASRSRLVGCRRASCLHGRRPAAERRSRPLSSVLAQREADSKVVSGHRICARGGGACPNERNELSVVPRFGKLGARTMSDNKSVVRRYFEEIVSQGRADAIDEVCAEDYVEYDPAWPGGQARRDHIRQAIPMYKKAFPDLLCTAEDLVAEGEKVAVYWKCSGTNLGELRGQPPTGKHGEVDVITLMPLRDGKAVEARSCYDLAAFRQQVGITTMA